MGYFYLSNPYNGSEEQKSFRAKMAARACGTLIKNGVFAVSPIVHNHAMMKEYRHFSLEERRTKILDFDFALLKVAKGMLVLKLEGWDSSYGVGQEIEFCQKNKIPIVYVEPANLESGIDLIREIFDSTRDR